MEANSVDSNQGAAVLDESEDGGMSPVDQAVENLLRGRDRDRSFGVLAEAYYRPVQRFFRRKVFSPEDCLDLTQETFMRVYKGIGGFRGEAHFGTWLFQIAFNVYAKWARQRMAGFESLPEVFSKRYDGEADGEADGEEATDGLADPLEAMLAQERQQQLYEAIHSLPEKMRAAVELRVVQDLSYQEIAKILGRSIETIKAQLHQARHKLREKLKDSFDDISF